MPDPILISHQGKLALLHPDGRKTDPQGNPLRDKPDAPQRAPMKRWHDPYS